MAAQGPRWKKSVYTYGPIGRALWTLGGLAVLYFLLSPLVHILRGGLIHAGLGALVPLFLAVGGVTLLVWVWPRFVRDVWKPASIAGDELTDLHEQTRREAALRRCTPTESDPPSPSQRTGPTRW